MLCNMVFKCILLCYYTFPIFSSLSPPLPCILLDSSIPPNLVHVHGSYTSSLASPFPVLFLTSPVYFGPNNYASYSLYLFPHCPPASSLLITLHVISISVILFLF